MNRINRIILKFLVGVEKIFNVERVRTLHMVRKESHVNVSFMMKEQRTEREEVIKMV
jgi:hypothetical protein